MAQNQHLMSVSIAGLTPRQAAGAPVEDSAARIRSALTTRLTTDHALLFGTPERTGNQVTWTTPAAGTVIRLDKLDPTRRARALARIDTLLADVRLVARRIAAEPGTARATAETLLAVSRTPAPGNVFVAGDTPIIVMWTHEDAPARPVPPIGEIARTVAAGGRTSMAAYASLVLGSAFLIAAIVGLARSHVHAQAVAQKPVAGLQRTLDQLSAVDLSHCRIPVPTK
jgi:hypothetical protein